MNKNVSSMPSMYNQDLHRKKVGIRRPLLAITGVLLALVVIRGLNPLLWWQMDRLELLNKPVLSDIQYTFLGFSSQREAIQELDRTGDFGKGSIQAVSYFNLLTPIGFAIQNRRDTPAMVDLGRLIVYSCPGKSDTRFYPLGLIVQECSGKLFSKNYENFLLQRAVPKLFKVPGNPSADAGTLSFIEKPLSASPYLRIPNLIYFYAPLLLLLVLTLRFGACMLTGFLYFVEVFFLFDYQQALVDVPLFWLKGLTGGEFDGGFATFVAAGIAMLALVLTTAGLAHWKSFRDYPSAKFWILFFLLLPFAFRF